MVKLVASDLDGTLLRSDGTLSQRTVAALGLLAEHGVPFVIVTQRPLRMVRRLADRYGLNGLAVCSNGALVADLATGRVLAHEPLDAQAACGFVAALRGAAPGVSFALEREAFFAEERGFYAQIRRHYPSYPFEPKVVEDVLELCGSPCTVLLALHSQYGPEALADMAGSLNGVEGVNVTYSGGPFIEVVAPDASKGAALEGVAERLGVEAGDVLAFGDMPNDLSMLAWAGQSVAMANGHPAVLSAAGEVTVSNDDDGVALVLERLIG